MASLARSVFAAQSRCIPRLATRSLSAVPRWTPASRLQVARYASTDALTSPEDQPTEPTPEVADTHTDWSKSYFGLSTELLQEPLNPLDIEMKPGTFPRCLRDNAHLVIKYRRIMNRAFGPGGWGLAPRTETNVGPKIVSREYALVCRGRLVAIARGEQEYFDPSGVPTATEACKSNALMRCCKDLGIASELWDPRFIREFKAKHCVEVFAEHLPTKKKDQPKFSYPYQE
ncbi:mitochondrial genome maintenance MGM101-domain-containing protein [Mucidula mucida]|nr:mitochondrial genome maintenance MGM101-domain-containing protein [Mucidula mucida]